MIKKRFLFFSFLCFSVGLFIFSLLPACLQKELYQIQVSEPYYNSPVSTSTNLLKIRSDVYGKGYFGASRNKGRTHEGVDLLSPVGTPIFASKSGRVSVSEEQKGYGQFIEIVHPDGLKTRYAHLSRRFAMVGDWVERGQFIGSCGKTGNAINPHIKAHLHFEIRQGKKPLNPSSGLLDPSIQLLHK